ncbi:copper resistance protein CopC [Subtercola sp. Z020]|uniref:copper resistance CopC family protein n=1 Tax=Subtercola sp. Z020 TaxID=2080582 RepID=UPI000CE73E05|nr:copper resistance CopC family protein [Subtercola sp. Z020]PPF82964.1 copper resistance protein CopC [Subtercola sp. Z020]
MPTFSLETRRRAALGLLAGLVLATVGTAAGAASPALAHDSIVSSSPENGEVVTEPIQAVSMTFSDDILTAGAAVALVTVTDVDDGHHESGCVTVDGTTVSTDVALGEAGEYTVTWQVTSSDGHPTSDTYTFTWQPSMPTATTTAMTTAPACGDDWAGSAEAMAAGSDDSTATAPAQAGATPLNELPEPTMTILNSAPVGQTDASPFSVPLLVAGLVGVVAALIAVVVVVMRRMRHS